MFNINNLRNDKITQILKIGASYIRYQCFTLQKKPIEFHYQTKSSPYAIHIRKIPKTKNKSRAKFRRKNRFERLYSKPKPVETDPNIYIRQPADHRIEIDVTESSTDPKMAESIHITKTDVTGLVLPETRKIPDRMTLTMELRKKLNLNLKLNNYMLSFIFPIPDVKFKECQKFGYVGIKILKYLFTLRGLMRDEYWLPKYSFRVRDEALFGMKIEEFGKLASRLPEISKLICDEEFWYFGATGVFDPVKYSRAIRAMFGVTYFCECNDETMFQLSNKFKIILPEINKTKLKLKFNKWHHNKILNIIGNKQINQVESSLNYKFKNRSIAGITCIHPAVYTLPVPHSTMFHWLCILGDCILDIFLAEYLLEYHSFDKLDGFDEMFYTRTKTTFANLTCDLNLHNIILHPIDYDFWLSIKNGTFSKDYLYRSKFATKTALIVEAVTGAVLVDCDFDIKKVHDVLYEKLKTSFQLMIVKDIEMEDKELKEYLEFEKNEL